MPKVLSSSAKLRLEKTSSVRGAAAAAAATTSNSSPSSTHHVHRHQKPQHQAKTKTKTKDTTSSSKSSNTNCSRSGGMKTMKKKASSVMQPRQQQQQQPRQQEKSPLPQLALPRTLSETTTPQRQQQHQVTAESSSLPSAKSPPKNKKEDALEKKKSRPKLTATSSSSAAAAAAAAAAPPPPPPSKHAMEQRKQHPVIAASAATYESSSVAVASSSGVATTATNKTATKSLKRKRSTNNNNIPANANIASHPFRIKMKCVVALRMQPQGNHVVQIIQQPHQQQQKPEPLEPHQQQQQQPLVVEVPIFPSLHFVHVWTNPLAGRDEGLALIGKRIRCFFPKNLVIVNQQEQSGNNNNNNNNNTARQKPRRVLEGEVVSVQASNCSSSSSTSRSGKTGKKKNASTTTTIATIQHFPAWKVELLVDKIMLDHFPFLIQTNTTQESQENAANNSKTHVRNSRLEQIIRGENKITVKMRLQNPNHAHDTESSSSTKNCVKWVIQKRVPTKLFRSSSNALVVGRNNNNGNTTITKNSTDGAVVKTLLQDDDDDATTTKLPAAAARMSSNPPTITGPATTTTTITSAAGRANSTIDPSSSSSHSPLLARTLLDTGNNSHNKTNGVLHNNVPTAMQTTAEATTTTKITTPTVVASSSSSPLPPSQQPVKKRRKLSSTENNNKNNSNNNNAVVIKHVGDGNDSADQQVANWRWLASRYHDYMLQQQPQSPNTMTDNINGQQPLSLSSSAAAAAIAESISAGLVGEVVKVEATSSLSNSLPSSVLPLSSLAFVTIRRLVLPELTARGRLPHHGLHDVFNLDNDDNNNDDDDDDDISAKTEQKQGRHYQQHKQQEQLFRIPVEELIVISRTIQNEFTDAENQQELELYRTHGYSLSQDKYTPLAPKTTMQSTTAAAAAADENMELSPETGNNVQQVTRVCHLCRRLFPGAAAVVECTNMECPVKKRSSGSASCYTFWCNSCVQSFQRPFVYNTARGGGGDGVAAISSSSCLPCCARVCDCRECRRWIGSDLHQDLYQSALDASMEIGMNGTSSSSSSSSKNGRGGFFSLAQSIVESVGSIDFGLPHDFLDLSSLPAPTAKPMTRIKIRKAKQWKKGGGASGKKRSGASSGDRDEELKQERRRRQPEDYSVFKPTCARLLPYAEMKRLRQEYEDSYEVPVMGAINTERPRNLRQTNKQDDDYDKDGNNKTMESRAARVKQRRLLKSVAGIQSFEVDTLAGRESQLRFGRSGIHAWGVYADADITAGDMIVEYRGELIENAMAEKREKEYETAKIGSDYMFRIDKDTVCDATKVGNVARFINASCDPNCYTKIISVGSEKRIVIYAKRDISAGQELCYDYKFPLEYDESKRIPCHCGSRNCRGFMNWDKRYVSVSSPEDEREHAATEAVPHTSSNNKE